MLSRLQKLSRTRDCCAALNMIMNYTNTMPRFGRVLTAMATPFHVGGGGLWPGGPPRPVILLIMATTD